MPTELGMIAAGIFLVIVSIFAAVEQRRAAKTYKNELAETNAQNRELIELQRETNRLLAPIVEKLDRRPESREAASACSDGNTCVQVDSDAPIELEVWW